MNHDDNSYIQSNKYELARWCQKNCPIFQTKTWINVNDDSPKNCNLNN